jgi:hypothetical protein
MAFGGLFGLQRLASDGDGARAISARATRKIVS